MNALQLFVANLCETHNIQKKELAEKIGISPATLSQNLAKGKPSKKTFGNLSRALGIPEEDIIRQYEECVQSSVVSDTQEIVSSFNAKRALPTASMMGDPKAAVEEFLAAIVYDITATITYKNKSLYASSWKETKDIVQTIETIFNMQEKGTETAAKAIEDLLISKYEKK
jgi:transcriptional regulator with XRE-family HTH domain